MSHLVVFDDREHASVSDGDVDFGPLWDTRACFEIRTGMLTTLERLDREWPGDLAAIWVPSSLSRIVAERSSIPVNRLDEDESYFLANGRWIFPAARFELDGGQALVEEESGHVVAANLSHDDARQFLTTGALPDEIDRVEFAGRLLARSPWDILNELPRTLHSDLMSHAHAHPSGEAPRGVTIVGEEEPVVIAPGSQLWPGVVLDNSGGPIVIDAGAVVRPGAVIVGPAYIGRGSTIIDRAFIKANSSIGPVCKIAGEIGATIVQGFSNKAHDGHIGDSLIGEWVNLGAGTTNSNLLNTYGEIAVRLRPDGPKRRTGRQYLGAIFGDHVKTAIQTRIMTGSVFGVGSMIASVTPPNCVGRFEWITEGGRKQYRFDKFIEVARTVMSRRDSELTRAMIEHLQSLHPEAPSA